MSKCIRDMPECINHYATIDKRCKDPPLEHCLSRIPDHVDRSVSSSEYRPTKFHQAIFYMMPTITKAVEKYPKYTNIRV